MIVGEIELDHDLMALKGKNGTIKLSYCEYGLCNELFNNAHKIVEKEIMERVFDNYNDTNVVAVYISHIKNKIAKLTHKKLIHTVRGVGYILTDKFD
jgi:DNA-binding response OmpR family regulator